LHPVLFRLGDLTVGSWSVMVALAIVAPALLVCPPLMRRRGVPLDFLAYAMLASVAGGLIGARVWNFFEHWPPRLHMLWDGGLTWYGAVLGGFLLVLAVCLWRRVPPGLWFNLYVPAAALGHAIGRVGCLLAGDGDYGRPSDLPWAMGFPHGEIPTPPGVRVHPAPIYESLVMLTVFVVLFWMARKPQPGWRVGGWFLVLAGAERFLVEFVRLNPAWFGGLTTAQWASIVSVVIGVTIVAGTRGRRPARMRQAAPSVADGTA
jgi:phosphatidylglycerol---prolipoprotein diacylglyceryl transferase